MKRGPIAFVAAAAGFAGVLGFHPGARSSTLALPAHAGGPATAPRSPAATTASKKPAVKKPAVKKPAPKKPGPPAVSAAAVRSATGSTEQYGYGQLAVRVTVRGTRIAALNVVGLTTAESYSQQLATQVIPMLRNEVLAAQSVRVNGISGATYTAEAYVYSIQSALDKLRVK